MSLMGPSAVTNLNNFVLKSDIRYWYQVLGIRYWNQVLESLLESVLENLLEPLLESLLEPLLEPLEVMSTNYYLIPDTYCP